MPNALVLTVLTLLSSELSLCPRFISFLWSSPSIFLSLLLIMSQGQAAIPAQPRAKQLRACLLCSIIQTPADFRKHGCPNCEEIMGVRLIFTIAYILISHIPCFVQMKGYADRIQSCTTTHFEGVIAVINPEDSWVARWQRTCTYYLPLPPPVLD